MSTELDDHRTALRVAIVGMGPRGLAVLERLLVRARAGAAPAELAVWAVDDVEPGVGRIWRVGQPRWLVMNTVAGQVTMYSDGPAGPPRAGHGPSLADWLRAQPDPTVAALGAADYAPRSISTGPICAMSMPASSGRNRA